MGSNESLLQFTNATLNFQTGGSIAKARSRCAFVKKY
jgi:hypothetical protein